MADNRELSLDEIAELSKPSSNDESFTIPGTNKRKKYDSSIRTVTNWFKMPHTMTGECEVPHHDEEREARNHPRMFFIDPMTHVKMCRWCFVESRDKLG